MKRRQFLATLPAAAGPYLATALGGGMAGIGALAAGCAGEPGSGPVEIKWDRETCARCKMVIGDRRFAAQTRDPAGKVWKFDDVGCATFWLTQQSFDEQMPRAEFWVSDYRGGNWLDARRAHYLEGKKSPMGYNFAALAEAQTDAVSYADARQRILARGK